MSYKDRVFGPGAIRIGQKLANHYRFKPNFKDEDMLHILYGIEDDELQKILGVRIIRND